MKNGIASSILIFAIAAYLTIPVLPVIDYLINRDYIARNLCVKRDEPKNSCKGKCHMVKQLQKTNPKPDNDSKNTNTRVQLKDLNEFILSKPYSYFAEISSQKHLIYSVINYKHKACNAIFNPPELV